LDSLFVEGIAASVSAVLVFCGSVWLLLTLVLGPRLAYFVTASVTLGVVLLMGAVWSYGDPLGPVGELPSWTRVGVVAETATATEFAAADEYPDGGGWFEVNADVKAETDMKSAAEGEAPDVLESAIEKEEVTAFTDVDQAAADSDATRLIERGGKTYAMVRFEVAPAVTAEDEEGDAASDTDVAPEKGDRPAEDDVAAAEEEEKLPDPDAEVFVALERHPGNPMGKARMIAGGTLLLLLLHLFGLSRSEKRARRVP
jgi:hypothetical protein